MKKCSKLLLGLTVLCLTGCSKEVMDPVVYEFEYEDLAKKTYDVDPNATPVPLMEFDTEESFHASAGSPKDVSLPEKNVDFEDLRANVNSDICAWIYIPDTKIDYPVLQHPSDDEYYLNHNLNGTTGYPGCIYIEGANSSAFTDPCTVLYGHNMKNGNMFAGIRKYADDGYADEHPYVFIYTPYGVSVYQVFAAYQTTDEHILNAYDNFQNLDVFEGYLNQVKTDHDVSPSVSLSRGSHIVTLSTCITGDDDARYVVQAVRLN